MAGPIRHIVSVLKKRDLKNGYYSITCEGFPGAAKCKPGQFLQVKIPSGTLYFRRALSVASADQESGQVEFIIKELGRGTSVLARVKRNDQLDILGPLGKPFTFPRLTNRVILVGGGVGFPPIMYLASELVKRGHEPTLIDFCYGGRTVLDLVERKRIARLGINFHGSTDDGSFGHRGLVTEVVEKILSSGDRTKTIIQACGPQAMLKAVDKLASNYSVGGELSLEAPMPCGLGICLGCVVDLVGGGRARVCADGPVFAIGEVKL